MGFLASRRIAVWTDGLKRWAVAESSRREGPGGDDYCLGVIAAVMASQRYQPPLSDQERKDSSLRFLEGYSDAKELIAKVLRSGVAPSRDYADLLSRPYLEPLTTDKSLTMEDGVVSPSPSSDGAGTRPPVARRRDWSDIRFDQQRDLWVCVAHDNPACPDCPNALAILSARNQGRSGQ